MKYAKGIMWLDDCRIPFVDDSDIKSATPGSLNATGEFSMFGLKSGNELDTKGRFTPNILVCDDMLNDGTITKQGKTKITQVGKGRGVIGNHDGRKKLTEPKEGLMMARTIGDGGSSSRYYDLDMWFDKMIEKL